MSQLAGQQFDPKNAKAFYAGVRARLTQGRPIPKPIVTKTHFVRLVRYIMSDAEAQANENTYLLTLARSIEAQELEMRPRSEPTLQWILHETAAKHGMTVPEIISARRDPELVNARHEYMWRAKRETSKSLPQIGRACGGRDHSTVLHGLRKYQERLSKEPTP